MVIRRQEARRELRDGWKELLSVRPEACSSWGRVRWSKTHHEEEQMVVRRQEAKRELWDGWVERNGLGTARGLQQHLGHCGLEHDAPRGGADGRPKAGS